MRYKVLFIVIVLVALLIRVVSLSLRTMHTDEAVHAFKYAEMMESGVYVYDKHEYHGPTLNYLTVIPALIRSENNLVNLNESTLRLVPAISGVMLILLLLLLAQPLGWKLITLVGFLVAISPPLVYFSKYYIQEILLIFFNAGMLIFLYRFLRSGKILWIVGSGVFAGLMMATKETWIILVFGQVVALGVVFFVFRENQKIPISWVSNFRSLTIPILWFVSASLITAILLFSSFFGNPAGIVDAVLAYQEYFDRAGQNLDHIHPWYYYFEIHFFNQCEWVPLRADLWVFITGLGGMIISFLNARTDNQNNRILLFVSVYTVITAVIFSILPYKTPWNALSFYLPLVFLAGSFVLQVFHRFSKRASKILMLIITIGIVGHLVWQSYDDNFRNYQSPCNPFAYGHPGKDIVEITEKVRQVVSTIRDLHIEVIVPEHGYWPLPWYFRDLPNVGWYERVEMDVPAAPLIICSTDYGAELTRKLFEIPPPGKRYLYIPLMDKDPEIRPGTTVSVYLRKETWDRFQSGILSGI